MPNFVSTGLLSYYVVKKPQILPFFGLWHFVVSPIGGAWRKLNVGAQLQDFHYHWYQNRFHVPMISWKNHVHKLCRSKA